MINEKEHPVEWAMLLTELDDAREHLESLLKEMDSGSIDQTNFAVDIGHVFAHLNRAWNSRSLQGHIPEDEWEKYSQFPSDLAPVG